VKLPVYLDALSTTPLDPTVLAAMLPFFTEHFGNASSSTHSYGWTAAEAVTVAREQVALVIGAQKEEIVFTSGATESCNLAIRGVASAFASKGNHIITCTTEHKAVLDTCADLEKSGMDITYLPVSSSGHIDLDELEAAIRPTTILLALMYANNETGVLHPIQEIGKLAKEKKILFFCDATQAVGKLPVDVGKDQIDLMALSAHKIYGPKGAGALYVRRKHPRVVLRQLQTGGNHERGFRSGTLNVPGIVGLGKAAEQIRLLLNEETERLQKWRDYLEETLIAKAGALINGDPLNRLPQMTNLRFPVQNGASFISSLAPAVAVSAGSACTSAEPGPSHVLAAMGLSLQEARSSIRLSINRFTTKDELDFAIDTIVSIVKKMQKEETGN
jgi:cysteine desulfurase